MIEIFTRSIIIICIITSPSIYGIDKKDILKIACRRNPLLSFCQKPPSLDTSTSSNNNNKMLTENKKLYEGHNNSNNTSSELTSTEDLSLPTTTPSTTQFTKKTNLHEIITLDDEALVTKVIDSKTNEEIPNGSSKEVGWKFSTLIDGNTGTNTKSEDKKKQKVIAIDNEVGDESQRRNNNGNKRYSGSNDDSGFGSLLRLPKPAFRDNSKKGENHLTGNTTSSPSSSSRNETATPTTMLVFVTKYCVDQRVSFKKSCLGKDIDQDKMELCKNYPLACQGKEQIMPVMYYCDKFEHDYDKLCLKKDVIEIGKVNDILRVMNFCTAYPTICIEAPLEDDPTVIKSPPRSNFVRCQDIAVKARKMCNPMPPESDTLNHVRCSQFMTHCKEYVDWV
uniref:DB domain-containing protein n=1 Tax=Strongyloides papillosus TaxID=174720 RepID=A0A0N5BIW8_STREA